MLIRCWTNVELPLGNGDFAVSPLIIVLIFPKHGHKRDLILAQGNSTMGRSENRRREDRDLPEVIS